MINLGRKQLKTLHKGDERIAEVYKGDDLIYFDIDALYSYKLTVKSNISNTGGTETNRTVSFPTTIFSGTKTPIDIDWGDGAVTLDNAGGSVSHTYASDGLFQVKVTPHDKINRPPKNWMAGRNFAHYKIVTIDTPLPKDSFVYNPYITSPSGNYRIQMSSVFNDLRNITSVPDNWLKNVEALFYDGDIQLKDRLFEKTFYYFGYNTGYAPFSVFKALFDKIDFSNVTAATYTFSETFSYAGYKNNGAIIIPSNLFSSVNTSKCTNLTAMFKNTFFNVGHNNTISAAASITVGEGLLAHIDTSKATTTEMMFEATFSNAFYYCRNVSFPNPFGVIDLSSCTNAKMMFRQTFSSCCYYTTSSLEMPTFEFLNTGEVTNMNSMFSYTMSSFAYASSSIELSEDFFSGLDTSSNQDFDSMFNGTFKNACYSNTSATFPNVFAFLDMSNATSAKDMFNDTFGYAFYNSTVANIPDGIFDNVRTNNLLSTEGLFDSTFYYAFYKSKVVDIPDGIFDNIDTSNAVNMSRMFRSTFETFAHDSEVAIDIANILDDIDTSNAANLSYFLYHTFTSFRSGGKGQRVLVPDNILAFLDTSNATDLSYALCGTFMGFNGSSWGFEGGEIPANLFSNINTSNCMNFNYMFNSTFMYYGTSGTNVGTIPATLFSFLDMTNATSVRGMFYGTFSRSFTNVSVTIPASLFANVSVGSSTSMQEMFYETFNECSKEELIVPSSLFSSLDTSNVTSFNATFRGTFKHMETGASLHIPNDIFANFDTSNVKDFYQTFTDFAMGSYLDEIPEGIFGPINMSAGTKFDSVFNNAFQIDRTLYGKTLPTLELKDVFDGMTYFGWVNASTAQPRMRALFAAPASTGKPFLTGSASTILQHFNFVPSSKTSVFLGQTNLTDYATINANWK